MRAEEREMDEPKLVACECSTDIEENLGNSLLPNLLVAILNAIAVNQRKKKWKSHITISGAQHVRILTFEFGRYSGHRV